MLSGKNDTSNNFALNRVAMFKAAREQFLKFDEGINTSQVSSPCEKLRKFKFQDGDVEYVIFGVNVNDQEKLNFDEVRKVISVDMGQPTNEDFYQFVGDSNLYSNVGTRHGQGLVAKVMNDTSGIVLYGFTGKKVESADESRSDVNQLLSDWVDAESEKKDRSTRVLANIVDEHTNMAIEKWGSSISKNVRYFYLVYSDTPTPSVKFGGDTISSDSITSRCNYCLDGGIQSLRQSIFMLGKNVRTVGITGMRDLSKPADIRYYDQGNPNLPYLSAVEFLGHMQQRIKGHNGKITKEVLTQFKDEYLSTHALFNQKKHDAGTKLPLWNIAWDEYLKLNLNQLALFSYSSITEPALKRTSSKLFDRVMVLPDASSYQSESAPKI